MTVTGWRTAGSAVRDAQGHPPWRVTPSTAAGDTFLSPHHLDVVPWASWSNTSGFTGTRTQFNALFSMGALAQATAAAANNGDWVEWSVCLGAGTYKVTVLGISFSDRASVDYTLDGAAVGTKDWYSAGAVYNVAVEFTGIAVTDGVHTFRGTVNGKNASSSDYMAPSIWFTFTRTGA